MESLLSTCWQVLEAPLEEIDPKDLNAELDAAAKETGGVFGDRAESPHEIPLSQPRPPSPAQTENPDEAEIADQEDEEAAPQVQQPPPGIVPERKIGERLRRVFQPRANGTYKVPKEMLEEYNNLLSRKRVMAMFEKVGYDPDRDYQQKEMYAFIFFSGKITPI